MTGRTAIALINPKSGTARTLGRDAIEAKLHQHLTPVFESLDIEFIDKAIGNRIQKIRAEQSHHIVIAGGGDGTVNAAAEAMIGSGIDLAVLPLGTMNLFVRALGFAPDLDTALVQLTGATPRLVDIGRANNRIFLHQVSFGLQPRMAKLRERIGYRSRLTKILASARAMVTILLNMRTVHLHTEKDGVFHDLKAPMVVISNNRLGDGAKFFLQGSLEDGELGVYVLHDTSLRNMFKLARAYLSGSKPAEDAFDVSVAESIVITPRSRLRRRKKRITASIDGEIVKLRAPLTVRVEPRQLSVLAP
jgi:diacylglycerol kinase family enzyme